jgi:hydrogenase maturation protease
VGEAKARKTLIQCLGNPLRGDDAAGPRVAELLSSAALPEGVEIREHWGEAGDLMDHWPGVDLVILVDAASSDTAPGSLHSFDARQTPVPRGLLHSSTHRFGVAEAVELARVLGRLPEQVRLYAIEGRSFALGAALSPEVEDTARRLAERIRADLNESPDQSGPP